MRQLHIAGLCLKVHKLISQFYVINVSMLQQTEILKYCLGYIRNRKNAIKILFISIPYTEQRRCTTTVML